MSKGPGSRRSEYDVIVVGSGLGGLTAAALLAKSGRKVLVVEKEKTIGGFAGGICWGARVLDTAIHLIMGAGTPSPRGEGLIRAVLDHLGVSDRSHFIRVAPFYRALFPDFDITVPSGRADFLAAHREHFPEHAHALDELMDAAAIIQNEMLRLPVSPSWWQKLATPARFPKLLRNLPLTLDEALNRYAFDARSKAVVGALWPYLGLPPSRVSFLVWAAMTSSYVDEGAFYCRGGFQRMVDAFGDGFRANGGDLLLGTAVRKILVDDERARGVVLENGETITSAHVISNIDARSTLHELVGEENFPAKYVEKVAGMDPSVFAAILYLPIERAAVPPTTVHETLWYESWDHDEVYGRSLGGKISGVIVTIPTLIDSSLAPPDEHLVVVSGFIPSSAESFPKDAALQLAECAEPIVPGVRDHVERANGTAESYRLRRLGPIYGWARSPRQIGPHGLGNETPISGLHLCGHWSQPGAGIRTVVISGIRVARLIQGQRTSEGVLSFLGDDAKREGTLNFAS